MKLAFNLKSKLSLTPKTHQFILRFLVFSPQFIVKFNHVAIKCKVLNSI